jgi:hypothetical protein
LPEQVCRYKEIRGKCRWERVVARAAIGLLFCGPAEVRAWVDGDARFIQTRREKEERGMGRDLGSEMDALAEFLLIAEEWKGQRNEASIRSNVMCELVWIFG